MDKLVSFVEGMQRIFFCLIIYLFIYFLKVLRGVILFCMMVVGRFNDLFCLRKGTMRASLKIVKIIGSQT